jgi:hypothetical protein
MSEADPFGVFEVGEMTDTNPASLRLQVGSPNHCELELTDHDYVIDAAGWTALGRRATLVSNFDREAAAAPAAALAAAIGAADLFKRAVGHHTRDWLREVNWSTWDHTLNARSGSRNRIPEAPTLADVGDLLLAGVGAVGSALLYILSLMTLRARVTVLDRDFVDTSNLNRSPLFTVLDAALQRSKTDVAQALLQSVGVEVESVHAAWRDIGEQLSRQRFDVWVSLTNEDGAWAEVPFQLPPVVLHGTTTSGWGIAFGRHIPRIEDCTACRLPRPHAEFRGPCSEAEIDSPDQHEPFRASLPFLSTVSAALIAAELMKLQFQGVFSLPNAVCADFRNGLPAVVATLREPVAECRGCQMADYPLWLERGGARSLCRSVTGERVGSDLELSMSARSRANMELAQRYRICLHQPW